MLSLFFLTVMAAQPATATTTTTTAATTATMTAATTAATAAAVGPDVRFAAGVLAAAFAAQPGVSVITNDDVRRALAVEADKQTVGCAASSSCLSEIAAALDANVVVTGAVDAFEDGYLVELTVFDARAAASVVRESARAPSRSQLADVVEERGWRLAAATRAKLGDEPLRVLILDLESRGAVPAAAAAASSSFRLAFVVAGALAATGAVSIIGGAVADNISVSTFDSANDDLDVSAKDANDAVVASNQWAIGAVVGYAVGAALFAGGGLALAVGLVE